MKTARTSLNRTLVSLIAGGAAVLLMSCDTVRVGDVGEIDYSNRKGRFGDVDTGGGILDGLGVPLVGAPSTRTSGGGGSAGIGVNTFLWRASLDTVAFMPLSSVDPFGGVIITDWYSPPEVPSERFKMTVYILDRQLRADGVKVSVFRQQLASGNRWVDSSVGIGTATELENAILTRARQLRSDIVTE
tara:strand:+ start:362 stop:925 length:564 start_codon:yes stop_codon:yes gene_type:complete